MKLATVLTELAKPESERTPSQSFDLLQEFYAYLCSAEAQGIRATGSFYPSGLDDSKCKRALAYNYLRAPVNEVHHEPRLMITFELGHYIHDRFQAMFERMAKKKGWTFVPEMRIRRETNPWFISGRCDGVLIPPPDGELTKEGVEFKSINKFDFNRLYDRPLYEHQFQGNLYQGLLELPRMHYVYICKDNSALKVFAMPFDRELFHHVLKKIERIMLKLQKGKLPKRITPDCKDPGCKFRQVCWSGATVERLIRGKHETIKEIRRFKPIALKVIE